ncbi:hypothetical protein SAMN05443144_11669 [Fodinibius roseus]|uniref:Uncharacterized protein n=1 Tax=Fodinibius roseus TaxID=1194090 RepID=A0A1M5G3D6_9BACT|nr:hypothetical protein [Fodinibius roseus]SHF98233.1 hypothetical protein SAMN05443144_11669 [Fodinibius roseus]
MKQNSSASQKNYSWPELPAPAEWQETLEMIYLWSQMAENSDELLFAFLQSTNEASDVNSDWDRKSLGKDEGVGLAAKLAAYPT